MTGATEAGVSLLATTLGVGFADGAAGFAGFEVAGGVVAGFDWAEALRSTMKMLTTAIVNRIFVRIITTS
jgi:hypothetical protein